MVVHPQAVQKAHQAGCAAGKQGKFNEFRHNWWEIAFKNRKFDDAGIEESPRPRASTSPTEGGHGQRRVQAARVQRYERVAQVPGESPRRRTFFINGTHVGGAIPKEQFKVIDEKLKEVDKSGVAPGDYYEQVVMAKGEKQFKSAKRSRPKAAGPRAKAAGPRARPRAKAACPRAKGAGLGLVPMPLTLRAPNLSALASVPMPLTLRGSSTRISSGACERSCSS